MEVIDKMSWVLGRIVSLTGNNEFGNKLMKRDDDGERMKFV